MVVGMATVAAGLGAFWMLQFRTQNRNPAEMSTWQYRHAQQAPEVNERVSTPGGGAKTSLEPPQPTGDVSAADRPGTATAGHQGSSGSASGRHDEGILASIMTYIQSDAKKSSGDGHAGQPAPIRRLNDRGGVYTKNSEYKDSYRRE
ncbi:hypothetical protein V8D89_014719 [Ganoderma adspersum]